MRLTLAALALATGLAGFGVASAEAAPVAPKAGIAASTQVVKAKLTRKRHVLRKKHSRKHVGMHRTHRKAAPRA